MLLDLPIAWRLALGFLVAAIIAAAAAGLTGLQRAQSSSREADFYQNLLVGNTALTTGDSFLQLLNTDVHTTLTDAAAVPPSTETLKSDQTNITYLTTLYTNTLNSFIQNDLLRTHPSEVAMLAEVGDSADVAAQNTDVASVLRTWQFYRAAQTQVMQDVAAGDLTDATALVRAQEEPTNSDAQSALRGLIQFDNHLAGAVRDAAQIEQQYQLITSLIAAVIAFLCIGAVGWIISESLVTRLNQLRRVTQLVEEGEVSQRVTVVGRDEVAHVTASVNGMLDTIVGLLEVTRRQRDALTNAAERLFTDVRLAGTGDLRINAAVGGDPIGMLANAFNFTIGRFRRFILRTQVTVEQMEVLSRQQLERAETFLAVTRGYPGSQAGPGMLAEMSGRRGPASASPSMFSAGLESAGAPELRQQTLRARELVRRVARDGANTRARELRDFAEQAYVSAGRVSQLAMSAGVALEQRSAGAIEIALRSQLDELRTLGRLLAQVGVAAYGVQENSGKELADLDAAIGRIAALATDSGTSARAANPPSSTSPGVARPDQSADLARLSTAFARDVAQMARQVGVLTHELRSGVIPFRVDPGDEESNLYAPGTGYNDAQRGVPDGYSTSLPRQNRPYEI